MKSNKHFNIIPLEERIVLDAALVAAVTQATSVIYVNANASGTNDGTSWANAFTNLQNALNTADSTPGADQIWVAQGTYIPGQNSTDTFHLVNNVGIFGGFAGFETDLSQRDPNSRSEIFGQGRNHTILTGDGVGVILDGLIVDGAGDPFSNQATGGGLLAQNSSDIEIFNSQFSFNYAYQGGAIYLSNSNLTIVNSTFNSNSAYNSDLIGAGGAIYSVSTLPAFNDISITNTQFFGNVSMDGGAIWASRTSLAMDSNFIFVNSARQANTEYRNGFGGGLYLVSGEANLTNNSFIFSSATEGELYGD